MAFLVFGYAQKLQGVLLIRCFQTLTIRFLHFLRQHFFMSRDSRKTCFFGGNLKKKTKLIKEEIQKVSSEKDGHYPYKHKHSLPLSPPFTNNEILYRKLQKMAFFPLLSS